MLRIEKPLKRRTRKLANKCYLCEEDKEPIDHLLVHSPRARMHFCLGWGAGEYKGFV